MRARAVEPKPPTRWPRRAVGGTLVAATMIFGPVGGASAVGEVVNVSPDSDLSDPASVNVSGHGFTASRTVSIYQCADVNGVASCSNPLSPNVPTNSSGAFNNTAVTVRKTFINDDNEQVLCSTNCRIEVWDNVGPHHGSHPISFPK